MNRSLETQNRKTKDRQIDKKPKQAYRWIYRLKIRETNRFIIMISEG